ncbi:hypothetical protein KYK30_14365 [Shinella yambaruensis]|uniref:Uncharacterized protein n=1 Tax=Shinella yambaruensis TaxID=415996 RepID=A0ABQ5ZFU1_9HYPH|nr:hypothetical protein [Shinella yambaruensis]MCJ8024440.1 hypothetical protein [Shinella yambaruensis]MCU7980882.1 hypothetical protein [Shinella yambaruensis]GLR49743.1 hypothetical protein GCM10007923_09480 [Shinella yambaruensis]
MPNIVDDMVYFLERQEDGKFHIEGEYALSDLRNTVPGFGDRITLTIDGVGTSIAEVVGRYFVRHIEEASDSEWIAWFIIVQSIEPQEADDLFDVISVRYTNFVRASPPGQPPPVYEPVAPPKLPKSKRISHKMKDPDFWTPERKEAMRKKREARLARMAKLGIPDSD